MGLARAIAAEPEIIFFDEPTTGLDPIMSGVINDLIREIVDRDGGATAVTITHDMSSVRAIADKVAMLHAGKIRWHGPVAENRHGPRPLPQAIRDRIGRGPDRGGALMDPDTGAVMSGDLLEEIMATQPTPLDLGPRRHREYRHSPAASAGPCNRRAEAGAAFPNTARSTGVSPCRPGWPWRRSGGGGDPLLGPGALPEGVAPERRGFFSPGSFFSPGWPSTSREAPGSPHCAPGLTGHSPFGLLCAATLALAFLSPFPDLLTTAHARHPPQLAAAPVHRGPSSRSWAA